MTTLKPVTGIDPAAILGCELNQSQTPLARLLRNACVCSLCGRQAWQTERKGRIGWRCSSCRTMEY